MFSWILVHTVIPAPGDGGEGNIDENGNKDDGNCLHQEMAVTLATKDLLMMMMMMIACSRGVISDTRTVRFSAAIVGAAVGREQPHAVHLAVVLLLPLRQAEELLWPVARHLVAEDGDVPPSKEDRVFTVALACTFLLDILAGGGAAEFLGTLPLLGRLHTPHHLLLAVPLAHLPTVRVQAVDPSCLLSLTTAPE